VPVQLKFTGIYKLFYGFQVSGDYQYASGQAVTETYTLTPAILGQTLHQSQTVIVVSSGPIRLQATNLSNIRLLRPTHFHDRYVLTPEFDIYNLSNSASITAVNQSVNNSSLALNPTTMMYPRLFKVGAKFEF
jgi:hypothetical protein